MKVTKTICRPGVSCCDLLIVLAVVGVLCMPLVWKLRQVERQKGAVAWVKAMNGDILYESDVFLCESDVYYPGERRPVFRGHRMKWLSELLGSTYLSTVVCVDLDDHKVTDLSPLTNLPNLRTLRLGDSHQVQDLSPLTKLKNLEHVACPTPRHAIFPRWHI